jgi:hypothetical protein
VILIWHFVGDDPNYESGTVKPAAPTETKRSPQTDCFFHSGFGQWHGHSSPDDDRWHFRNRYSLGREYLITSARERATETAVFALVVLAAAWPVVYMIVSVVELLIKGHPLDR